jgi:hypothetical protein
MKVYVYSLSLVCRSYMVNLACMVVCFLYIPVYHFSPAEHIIAPGSHIEFQISTKNSDLVKYYPINILAKFDLN